MEIGRAVTWSMGVTPKSINAIQLFVYNMISISGTDIVIHI